MSTIAQLTSDQQRLYQILQKPIISEKSTIVAEKNNQVVFNVLRDASKKEVKAAIELAFDVEVDAVRILNVKGKQKTFSRISGKRSDWKKAYISLKEGSDIDFTAFQS
ncbi:MAG: 50S ribosomal protein L23 [Proteobacteria bacterium]|jgi:large subunit ribosomal protein L23|nr:50S ribosomal protein L23 [Pseudomonadota bacterium]